MSSSTFIADLAARGMINQITDQPGLESHLSSATDPASRICYAGFDPTADSLTIGNLVTIMALARFQRAGHTPIALMGGATGLIGDPSGKSAERTLSSREEIAARVDRIRRIFDGGELFDTSGSKPQLQFVNNIDWLGGMGFLDALREIGKHFSVNMMIQKDSVKDRLTNRDQGISYTEFSYMLLQAYDYFWLHQNKGVTLQMGGSDQFGNIVVGMDLIARKAAETRLGLGKVADLDDRENTLQHKVRSSALGETSSAQPHFRPSGVSTAFRTVLAGIGQSEITRKLELVRRPAFGLTWPLVTKADGTKFGKTESGSIWLSPDRTSPYAYYQFWLNAADADAERFLKIYTFLPVEQISALMAAHAANPGAREAQRTLAREATRILHGPSEVARAEAAAAALFSGDVRSLDAATLADAFSAVPSSNHDKSLLAGEGVALLDVMVPATGTPTSLAKSRGEAKQFLTDGSVSVNGQKAAMTTRLTTADLLPGSIIALRRGKKNWHITRWA